MIRTGEVEIEVGGVKRYLKFGVLASGYFCKEENISLKEMTKRLSDPTPITAINCVFSAAKAYNAIKKIPVDFTQEDVSVWIDEIGLEKTFDIIYDTMSTHEDKDKPKEDEKNQIAPDEPGQIGTWKIYGPSL
jgi:hypothetical protein